LANLAKLLLASPFLAEFGFPRAVWARFPIGKGPNGIVDVVA